MRRFLKQIFLFAILILVGVSTGLYVTTEWVSDNFDYRIPAGKNVLVLGDSHTQCAIDTDVLKTAINLSESADTYFYSYLKLNKILAHNKIDTLIIGYSHNNVAKAQDNWLFDQTINSSKLPVYFFLFEKSDLQAFFGFEPMQLVRNIPGIIRRNFSHTLRIRRHAPLTGFGIGGYKPLHHTMGQKEYAESQIMPAKADNSLGTEDIVYLKKIYDRCERENVKVVLLAPPVLLRKSKDNPFYAAQYEKYASEQLPRATKINYSDMEMPTDFFADAAHLNSKGAARFTSILKSGLARR